MAKLKITLALPDEPRIFALLDGKVKPEGIELQCIHNFKDVGDRHEGMMQGKFDASEMSTTSFIRAREEDVRQIAIPVFYIRGLRQRNFLVNKKSGIKSLSELEGKKIGVTRYAATTIVWARGLLQDEYRVPPERVKWIVAENEVLDIKKPEIKMERLGKKRSILLEMLQNGEIDAAIFPGNDAYFSIYPGGSLDKKIKNYPDIKILIDDLEVILDYYRRTKIYPIIHTITIKEEILDKNPWVGVSLLNAFRKSKELAWNYMDKEEKKQVEEEMRLLERDPYDYRLNDEDRETLETLINNLLNQGLLERRVEVNSLFAKDTI